MRVGEYGSAVPWTRSKPTNRCGHYELVKVGTNWKCTACGQILTISESIQNSIELSEVMRTAVESRVPLSESLDVLLGRREWEEIRAKIPTARGSSARRLRRCCGVKRRSVS